MSTTQGAAGDEHPTQAVTPGADAQEHSDPDPRMVDPVHAAEAEFAPVLDERTDADRSEQPVRD
jgi:hypothetical protein